MEGFIRHPHSTIIIKLFKWARSKMLWSQVRDKGFFSCCWLSVFLRHDISCDETFRSFRLIDQQTCTWHSPTYDFPISPSLRKELELDDSMCSIYGVFTMLPKSKSCLLKDHSKNEVLIARCACKDQLITDASFVPLKKCWRYFCRVVGKCTWLLLLH